jgi:peroxiredoxin
LAVNKYRKVLDDFIETKNDYKSVINVIKQDEFLKNDSICELVLIKGLYECYYDRYFYRESIVSMLIKIKNNTKINKHRVICDNILNSFSKLKPDTKAPFFQLPDKNGLTHSIDELRNKKYLYVSFFNTTCTACLQQMKTFTALKKKYGRDVNFVSISVDDDVKVFKDFCAKNPQYDWLLLYNNVGDKLKKSYEIISYPKYFLIDPDGYFIQAPAESPEGNIRRAFVDISNPRHRNIDVGSKRNR